jgi:hypothetical protein
MLGQSSGSANQASGSANQASGSGTKKPENLNEMLNRLGIEEDEIDDLVFEETDIPKEGIKWMALAKVHTTNYFSPQSFEHAMRVAWSPAKEVKFTALEENLFTIQCFLFRRLDESGEGRTMAV